MWDIINQVLLAIEIILIVAGALFVWGKKNAMKTFIFLSFVFVINFTIYIIPGIYGKIVLGEERNFLFYLMDIFPAAVKSLVGDGSTGIVEGYCGIFPLYVYIYITGLLLGVITTSYAAISTFGYRILNVFKVAYNLNSESCDIIKGGSPEALDYAKTYKRTIIALSKSTDKTLANDLINSGYTVIRRNISKEFLDSRLLNLKTRYNVVLPDEEKGHYEEINSAIKYFETSTKIKNIHFYIETEEAAIGTEKNYIDKTAKEYCQKITLFSRNELVARTFVDENPMTKYMPADFFNEDTSLKENVGLNMFFLGYNGLSREIYRQFIINNQFCVLKGGELQAFPINYFIYDKNKNEKIWEINGLKDTLSSLSEKKDEYFPLPEMPYNTECIEESAYEFDCIKKIAEKIQKENSFSCILIDTGDVYNNIEIAERFNLLLNRFENFRVFIYNNSEISVCGNVSCYGNTKDLFTHDVIVNEGLTALARSINTFYSGEDTWSSLSYFDMSSNIALASNLRFKLNLMRLDYVKSENKDGCHLIKEALDKIEDGDFAFEDYLTANTRNVLLAQEHLRWNAYHLLSGYLPMKKSRIILEKDESGKIKKTIKNNFLKKHACITTYKGLSHLSEYLSEKANNISADKTYKAEDFDYYKYDDLLLRAMPDFFSENNYSVIKI